MLISLLADLKEKSFQMKSAIILIGQEGGFSPEEAKMASDNGFYSFTLGPRRLRSETAGIVASAVFMELLGEMR